jgi:predicted ATPase
MLPFRAITLKNFLSFGPEEQRIELGPLNILIGPNGSGKSNFLEALYFLQTAPEEFGRHVRRTGGYADYLYRSGPVAAEATFKSETQFAAEPAGVVLEHILAFTAGDGGFRVQSESVAVNRLDWTSPATMYSFERGSLGYIVSADGEHPVREQDLNLSRSALNLFRHPTDYEHLRRVSETYQGIHIFRDAGFGRSFAARGPQRVDLIGDRLESDASNLFVVLHQATQRESRKKMMLGWLQRIYPGIVDFSVDLYGTFLDLSLWESSGARISSTRLSDGTLRFACLLALLLDPDPPALLCLDEPELGLHPDLMRSVGELLEDASTRTQLIVATHSEHLIDYFSHRPEIVRVFDRTSAGTTVQTFSPPQLKSWLEDYTLGQVWRMGYLGGNRW